MRINTATDIETLLKAFMSNLRAPQHVQPKLV